MFLRITALLFATMLFSCGEDRPKDICKKFDAADLEMLQTHDEIRSEYKANKLFIKKLEMAQVYWIQYRDRHMDALYPNGEKFYQKNHKAVYADCLCEEMTRLTELRTAELRKWLESAEDCPSSLGEREPKP